MNAHKQENPQNGDENNNKPELQSATEGLVIIPKHYGC